MDLFLWRHADAGTPWTGPEDVQRPLSAKGRRQARRMAAWLERRLPREARILTSPARRARETAQALGRAVEVTTALGPYAAADNLILTIAWPGAPDAPQTVLMVGHQPALGQLAARLLAGVAQDWVIRKGSVWWLRSRPGPGGPEVVLRAVRQPDDT